MAEETAKAELDAYAHGFEGERAQEPFIHLFEMAIHLREVGAELNHEVSEWLKKS